LVFWTRVDLDLTFSVLENRLLVAGEEMQN
jgi:hypothetical protein